MLVIDYRCKISLQVVKNMSLLSRSIRSLIVPIMERSLIFKYCSSSSLSFLIILFYLFSRRIFLRIPADVKLYKYSPTQALMNSSNHVPHLLTHLSFGRSFNQPIPSLPQSLKSLTFGLCFNQPVDTISLPSSLSHLTFGECFNQPVSQHIPLAVTHLSFGNNFNQPVDTLPSSLLFLTFGIKFNQSIDHLPPALTNLVLGRCFNHITNHLPLSLVHLSFGTQFDQQVDNLPPITHLSFGEKFNHPISKLPNSLTHLVLASGSFRQSFRSLPPSLFHITFGSQTDSTIDNFAPSVTHLVFHNSCVPRIKNLPPNLTHLTLGGAQAKYIPYFPITLQYLKIVDQCYQHSYLDDVFFKLPPFSICVELAGNYPQEAVQRMPHITLITNSTAITAPPISEPDRPQRNFYRGCMQTISPPSLL